MLENYKYPLKVGLTTFILGTLLFLILAYTKKFLEVGTVDWVKELVVFAPLTLMGSLIYSGTFFFYCFGLFTGVLLF